MQQNNQIEKIRHDFCTQEQRLGNIETGLAKVETENAFQNQEIKEWKETIRENTTAINHLCNQLNTNTGWSEAIKWGIPVCLTIVTIILSKLLHL